MNATQDRERHAIQLRNLHTGDHARVSTAEHELDPVEVLAVWPYYQADFDSERHTADVHTKRWATRDMTVENPVWEPKIKHIFRGIRVTFATPDGGRYAVVDWGRTEDPPILYYLLIAGADADTRRWKRTGTDPRVERYGEPVPDRKPEYNSRLPSEDIPPVEAEQNANPDFSTF